MSINLPRTIIDEHLQTSVVILTKYLPRFTIARVAYYRPIDSYPSEIVRRGITIRPGKTRDDRGPSPYHSVFGLDAQAWQTHTRFSHPDYLPPDQRHLLSF